jgi:xylulokinase
MALVAGVDSSTQSVKVVVRDAQSGAFIREARAPHPDGTEVDPRAWWSALESISETFEGVAAVSVAAQQHGMVVVDEADEVIRPALLWNDTRSATDAADLVAEAGGPEFWADAVGSVPLAAFTVAKARWLARVEPDAARRVARMMLPHDYLTWLLGGQRSDPTTDRGDASGTGYWSPASGEYRDDLLGLALGHVPEVPRVAAPHETVGETSFGAILGPGTGDNMAAALALDVQPGDVVVSLGTSGTAFAGSGKPTADASGFVAGFADATGAFLPLVCTLNAARVLTAAAQMLDVDLQRLTDLAAQAEPGSGGLVLLPYLDGERTPNLPDATGSLHGMTRDNMTAANIARSAFEGMLGGLADAVDALRDVGVEPQCIKLIGGAAANPMVADVATTLFAAPVEVPEPGEYVADGAARQAAWTLLGGDAPPDWSASQTRRHEPQPVPRVRENYRSARQHTHERSA